LSKTLLCHARLRDSKAAISSGVKTSGNEQRGERITSDFKLLAHHCSVRPQASPESYF